MGGAGCIIQCILVSDDTSQYMLATVPFDFKDPKAAVKALDKFRKSTVWEITNPALDAKAKPEYSGCPVKNVLLLTKPTTLKAVPPTNTADVNHPTPGLRVHLDIKVSCGSWVNEAHQDVRLHQKVHGYHSAKASAKGREMLQRRDRKVCGHGRWRN